MLMLICIEFPSIAQQSGDLDSSFNQTGKVTTSIYQYDDAFDVAIQPDGKIISVGQVFNPNDYCFGVTRHLPDGTPDSTFNGDGKLVTDPSNYSAARRVVLQPDGKIIAAGSHFGAVFTSIMMVRYISDGSLDSTFGINGIVIHSMVLAEAAVNDLALQTDGKILVTCTYWVNLNPEQFAVFRYNPDGTPDSTFGSAGKVILNLPTYDERSTCIGIQSDNKIIVGGFAGVTSGVDDFIVIRLDSTGNLDTSFGIGGIATCDFGAGQEDAIGLEIQPDDKIILCGTVVSPVTSIAQAGLARFYSNGTLDTTFNGVGSLLTTFTSNLLVYNMALQPDGKIVVCGEGTDLNKDIIVLRYTSTGSLDTTFSNNGFVLTDFGSNYDCARAVAIQNDGNIVAAGRNNQDFVLARYIGNTTTGLDNVESTFTNVILYPNPVSNTVQLKYSLSEPQHVSIRLFDMGGKLIKTFIENQFKLPGEHQQELLIPQELASGSYFVVIGNRAENLSIKIVK